ncbi:hypothetical protein QBC43DRAFT_139344 [Cladorrhinum sp. PSN259]|nr:hypothetical protein QBC43DRAFT_139344 [Cladorrhinum sp. PSN259]
MPYAGDIMEDPPLAMIQSDLQDSVEAGYSPELDFRTTTTTTATVAGVSVFNLAETEFGVGDEEDAAVMPPPVPEADIGVDAFEDEEEVVEALYSSAKKRGRPSRSASGTPAKSVATSSKTPPSNKSKITATPKSATNVSAPKSARASTGRKQKAEEIAPEEAEPTPAAKRGRASGRPSRTAGVAASARLAAKGANKPKRGRPKSTDTTEKKPKGKGGRPKKNASEANGEVLAGEYEVEAIRDSRIDAETMEHWYEVKWKGYPESENSWEPKINLKHSLDLVKAFDTKKKKQEIEDAVAKAQEKVAKAPAKAKTPKAVKPVKPAKKSASPKKKAAPPKAAPATAGRRGRPTRATSSSK